MTAAACGDGGSESGSGAAGPTGGQAGSGGEGTGAGGGEPACEADRFGAAEDFTLPQVGGSSTYVGFRRLAGEEYLPNDVLQAWATVDMDGDGKPDLVRTYLGGDPTVGNDRWIVYRNNGKGFGPAEDFTLPQVGGSSTYVGFRRLAGEEYLPNDVLQAWATVDMDGDGKPDLVRTYLGGDPTVGNDRWIVYRNTGNGFGAAEDFTLPLVGGSSTYVGFRRLAGEEYLPNDVLQAWATVDMDGDGKPDLVRTYLGGDATVGNDRWLVYRNDGKGFGAAEDFALPQVGGSSTYVGFRRLAGEEYLPNDVLQAWATVDMGGDRKPDLVRTYLGGDPTVGNDRWIVYRNDGKGFGTAEDFALPQVGGSSTYVGFRRLAGEEYLPNDVLQAWTTVDMGGDGKPDLVRTYLGGDATVGNDRWIVYPGVCTP